jgi:hypothetical protein
LQAAGYGLIDSEMVTAHATPRNAGHFRIALRPNRTTHDTRGRNGPRR